LAAPILTFCKQGDLYAPDYVIAGGLIYVALKHAEASGDHRLPDQISWRLTEIPARHAQADKRSLCGSPMPSPSACCMVELLGGREGSWRSVLVGGSEIPNRRIKLPLKRPTVAVC
jgi:hypothetical protein